MRGLNIQNNKCSIVAVFVFIFTSCVNHQNYLPSEEIVERSKEFRPQWVEYSPGEMISVDSGKMFVITRSNLTNISLGLKQIDLASVSIGKKVLADYFKEVFLDKFDQNLTKKETIKLENFILNAFKNSKSPLFIVKDIYYEKIKLEKRNQKLSPYYYNAFVLIEFSNDLEHSWVKSLKKLLSRSSDRILTKIGKSLKIENFSRIAH